MPFVDGWIVPEQPTRVFAEGRQVRVPVLVGSNADEATVLAHSVKNIYEFNRYLRNDAGEYAKREFELYPAGSDTEVPGRYLEVQNDSFEYGAYSMAQAMSRAGEKAYLYYFSWANGGDRARLGAYHGEELHFLAGSFSGDWTRSPGADELGLAMRTYWTQFARAGNPNSAGLPEWPAFDSRKNQCLDLGSVVRVREVPNLGRLQVLEQIMKEVVNQTLTASR